MAARAGGCQGSRSDVRHAILIEPLRAASCRRASPPWPEWRNWQTRRTQNPVHRKVSVGSTPSSGTIPHSVRSGAVRAAQARDDRCRGRQRARPPGRENLASLGLVAARAAQARGATLCAAPAGTTPSSGTKYSVILRIGVGESHRVPVNCRPSCRGRVHAGSNGNGLGDDPRDGAFYRSFRMAASSSSSVSRPG